jgi:uncharacterized protein YjbJ (UPF0337 family)
MVDQQVLKGQWNEVRGKLKEKWGQLTDDDIKAFEGTTDNLIGRIQRRTGETRKAIEGFLEEVTEDGSHHVEEIAEQANAAMNRARESVEAMASRVSEGAQEGYDRMEEMVMERPGQSLLVAFGIGLVSGIGVAMLLKSAGSSRQTHTEALGRQLLDSLQGMLPDALARR